MNALRGSWLLALLAASTTVQAGEVSHPAPETVVRGFLADYEDWNNRAFKRDEGEPNLESMSVSEREYRDLIAKYCVPTVRPQPIAYGSDASHTRADKILSTHISGAEAVVVTEHAQEVSPKFTLRDQTEFHLKRIGDRWLITSALALLDDGKYELL